MSFYFSDLRNKTPVGNEIANLGMQNKKQQPFRLKGATYFGSYILKYKVKPVTLTRKQEDTEQQTC